MGIVFDDNTVINAEHCPDCCENNYADFEQIDDVALNYTFKGNIEFEAVDGSGFRFGDSRMKFFVPCYSEQNGYYSSDIDIYWTDGNKVLTALKGLECEFVYR